MSSILLVDDRLEFGEFQSVTARPSKATHLPQGLEDIRPSDKIDPLFYHLCPLPTTPILPVASLFVSTITSNQHRRLLPLLLPKP